jgi:hypothetical protein
LENANPALHAQLAAAVLPSEEFEFAGHARHAAADVAAVVGEYVPAAQSVHAALPVAVLYLPATQAVHGPPSGPVYPALQPRLIQAALDELAIGEVKPVGHAMHAPEPVALL